MGYLFTLLPFERESRMTGIWTAAPPLDGDDDPIVRSNDFLEDPAANGGGVLYSEYTVGYYLLGAADKKVDGIDGFGYTKPNKPVAPASGTDLLPSDPAGARSGPCRSPIRRDRRG